MDAVTSLLLDYSDLTNLLGELEWPSFVQGYRDFELLHRDNATRFVRRSCCVERLRKLALHFTAA